MSDDEPCPLCGSSEYVERIPCRCMSCPPWACFNPACKPPQEPYYEFYWSDDE
jgi:hypothetical protein